MWFTYRFTALIGAGLLATAAHAQAPDSTLSRPTATPAATGSGTLLRVGTGLTRGLYTDYWGLSAPLTLGVEHHLTPRLSAYANGFASFRIGQRNRYADGYRTPLLGTYGFDAGVRYYYNQERRRQQGRPTGPFVGNYLALQTTTYFQQSFAGTSRTSMLMLTWGMQRRLGRYGWLDAYAGGGVGQKSGAMSAPSWGIYPEVGVKFSLGKVVK